MAARKDLIQLAELRWEFRVEDGAEQPVVDQEAFVEACSAFLQQGLASGYHTHWIAEQDGGIVSHLLVHRIDLVPRPCKLKDQIGIITNNYTRPAYRGLGIGSELIKRVKRWAMDEDLELLIVYPSDEAVTFYERAGFSAQNDVMELKLRPYYSPTWGPETGG